MSATRTTHIEQAKDTTEITDIAVAVDGSESSAKAIAWAANVASKKKTSVTVVSAYNLPQFMYAEGMVPPQELYEELAAEAQDKVDAAYQAIKSVDSSIEVRGYVEESTAIDLLLKVSHSAEMIVMGSRGRGGLSGLVLGSVSAAVVSHAHCPVVVVRTDSHVTEDNKYGAVLVGVDGSEVSRAALQMAFKEAQARKATLRAVHAWSDPALSSSMVGLVQAHRQWEEAIEEEKKLLEKELEPMRREFPDVQVEALSECETPVRALMDKAKDAQLVVVGSHGRGGFAGMLLGSTSRALLQSAPSPLMVVHPRNS